MTQLRNYQREAVNSAIRALEVGTHPLVSLPTGSGKSHVIAELVRWATRFNGVRVFVVTHSKELVEQDYEKINAVLPDVDVGIYCAGLGQKRIKQVTVVSIQSIHRAGEVQSPDLIIVDEAHRIPHSKQGQYRALFERFPDAQVVGLTATPYRMNTGMLHEGNDALFDDLVYEASTLDLIKQGYLCRVRARATKASANLDGVHTRGGEFVASEMTAAFDVEDITKAAVEDVLEHAKDRRSVMVFCCSIEHCNSVEAEFRRRGEGRVVTVTEKTTATDRRRYVNDFRRGEIRVMVNCAVFTTGFDAPNVDCIALLRATCSPGLYVQMVGRGLRLSPGKDDCLLLDYGRNVERHGPLDMITSKRISDKDGVAPTKTCQQCGSIIFAGFAVCPECSYVFPKEEKETIKHEAKSGVIDPLEADTIEELEVTDVAYREWKAKSGALCIRVDYYLGLIDRVSEWVFPEHTGYAGDKSQRWFARRGQIMPISVKEALKLCPKLLVPSTVLVRKNGKYREVIGYRFTRKEQNELQRYTA